MSFVLPCLGVCREVAAAAAPAEAAAVTTAAAAAELCRYFIFK